MPARQTTANTSRVCLVLTATPVLWYIKCIYGVITMIQAYFEWNEMRGDPTGEWRAGGNVDEGNG